MTAQQKPARAEPLHVHARPPSSPAPRAPREGHHGTVPYIVQWSEERDCSPELTVRQNGDGVGYADETPGDRDAHGVLWRQVTGRRGQGRPLFGSVHPLRQRRAMRRLLCQVCGRPADRDERGVL